MVRSHHFHRNREVRDGCGVEARFEAYCDLMVKALGHADRATPARWYLRGLMLPGQRKSIEPMAARVHPEDVCSAHQSMHHLVADSDWSDSALLSTVAAEVVPVLRRRKQAPCFWIIDDTGLSQIWPAFGGRCATVLRSTRQGRQLPGGGESVAGDAAGSVPLAYRLYLPQRMG